MPAGDWDPAATCLANEELQVRVIALEAKVGSFQDTAILVAKLRHRCAVLQNQLRGGFRGVDPRTEAEHPGHVLIRLGWTFCPEEPDEPDDEIGAYWMDPEEKGTGTHTVRSLPAALSIACRRLLDKACKTRLERLVEDGDV